MTQGEVITLLLIIFSPFLAYFLIKMGTAGYYRARELFEERKNKTNSGE